MAGEQVRDQRIAGLLDQVENALEVRAAAVVRIGHVLQPQMRREIEEQAEVVARLGRSKRPELAEIAAIHREDPVEACEVLARDLAGAHGGNNRLEGKITRSNVATLAFRWEATLPSPADGAPVALRGVVTPSGLRDLLFVTTKDGHVVAVDARTGSQVWSRQYPADTCRINNGSSPCYTTSSPAVDPGGAYVYSYGLDGYVHKLQVGDGTEIVAGGWPQLATLKAYDEKSASALAIARSQGVDYLYVVHGGYPGDNGDYQGHVTTINLASGAQKVFNTMCSDQAVHLAHAPGGSPTCAAVRSAVWSRPGVVYHAALDRLFFATGNGTWNGSGAGTNWSESVLAIRPDGSGVAGKPVDAYTPSNWAALDSGDADVGSSGPAIVPAPTGSVFPHLAVQAGKDGRLRLLDLDDLSGAGGPGHVGGEAAPTIGVPQGNGVFSQPAVWVNPADNAPWVFVVNSAGASGLKLVVDGAGMPSLATQWTNSGTGGTSPLVANDILYHARSGSIRALDPVTGSLLWSSTHVGGIHWESPIVSNGWLYVTDEASHLTAFAPPVAPTRLDADFNGMADLLWRGSSGATVMWLMNGVSVAGAQAVLADPNWRAVRVADFDGNGKADLVFKGPGGSVTWLMNGTTPTAKATLTTDTSLDATHVGDFNGDGKTDILWRRSGGAHETSLWLMNGTTSISRTNLTASGDMRVTHVADLDGDGRSDIVWRNDVTGATVVWLMNGATAVAATIHTDPNWQVIQVADLDGDGKADLIWRNVADGRTAAWLMDGTKLRGGAQLLADPSWTVVGTGDFDDDGKADLVWRNATTGGLVVWLMNGLTMRAGAVLLSDPAYTVAGIADFNGDGRSDLVLRDPASNRTVLWLMNGTSIMQGSVLLADPAWSVQLLD